MQFLKSRYILVTLILTMALCLGCGLSVLAAEDYELEKLYLYDYSDMDDRIVLSGSGIKDSMSQVVEWQTVRIRADISAGDYQVEGANLDGKYYVVTLHGEATDLTIKLLNDKGKVEKRYYLQLRKATEGLESVTFTGDDYEFTFDNLSSSNVLTVPARVDELNMEVEVSSNDYIVKYNTKESDDNTWKINLPKESTIPLYITVSNEDNPDDYTQYKIEVTRLSDDVNAQGSLSSLKVKNGTESYELFPAFDPEVYNYYVLVPNNAKKVTFTPTLGASGTSVTVNGGVVANGKPSEEITASTNGSQVSILVTDANDQINVYTINLLRTTKSEGDEAEMVNLRVKSGTSKNLNSLLMVDTVPEFDNDRYDYELVMDAAYGYFSFRPAIADSNGAALLLIDDKVIRLSESTYCDPVQMGIDSEATIRVFSADFKHTQDYNFTVAARELDDNYLLKTLELRLDGVKVSLSPSFSGSTYSYTASGDDTTKNYTITAVPVSEGASVTVNGEKVAAGVESDKFELGTASSTAKVEVTAENGDSVTYRLKIDRSGIVGDKIILRIGSMTYIANGESKPLAAAPYITNSRTQVPVRVIAESLGASVHYDNVHKQITIKKDGERMYMDIGKVIKDFDVAPEVKANTTFVPIRYVSEKLNCKCVYNNDSKEIIITHVADDK